ncbi:uncharacterized protein N7458_003744 [Penicillium daleae]|uniref:Glycosyltransferase n=1 Tax=Penicillium daleae TaxID=63821 RepID=A0AAD6CAY3_9EURO|nr:uncharacterized protein N7458_003744 [Penicillium daleae]KAJ5456161.1 hypothetical protein N7458_003744 [Penicillium daleae]
MAESSPLLASFQEDHDQFPSILQAKKVLLATESWGPVNGVSRTTRSLVEYLRRHGVELILVAPHFKGDTAKQRSKTFKPDIIYLAGVRPRSAFKCSCRFANCDPPPVCSFRTDLSAYSIMLPTPLDQFGVWLLATVRDSCFSAPSCRLLPMLRHSRLPGTRRYPPSMVVQLGRGVDTVLFTPRIGTRPIAERIAPGGEIILICVCRIAPEKGFEFLAQVATRLAADKVPFKLLIVGGTATPRWKTRSNGCLTRSGIMSSSPGSDGVVGAGSGLRLGRSVLALLDYRDRWAGRPGSHGEWTSRIDCARSGQAPPDIIRHDQTGYLVAPHDLDRFTELTREVAQDSARREDSRRLPEVC